MKKAFTMIELILVIVIVGILSATLVPRLGKTSLDKAAQQILQHIRYTQHLAMMNNKYDPNKPDWFRSRWQLRFQYSGSSPKKYYYSIYSDEDDSNNMSQPEIAKNPSNPSQLLTGLKSMSTNTGIYTKQMDLYNTYNIKSVSFSGCMSGGVSGALRIYFDSLGRPMGKNPHALDNKYIESDHNKNYLFDRTCTIKIIDIAGEQREIVISPETGYAHIINP